MYDLKIFINYLREDERSENTVAQYTSTTKLFFAKYTGLNNETARDYKTYLAENFKPKTVNCRLAALKRYAECFSIPIKIPKKIKLHRQLSVENVITPDEFNALCSGLKKSENIRGYWLVMFLAKTGARVSEFVRLPQKALETGYAEMFTKGKVRRIYIPESLINESRGYFSGIQNDLLFPSRYKKQITPRGVTQLLQNFGMRYGIRKEVMHPHGFRHFFAKEFLRKGGDIALLSDWLGHESLGTTAIYTRHSSEEMAQKLSAVMAWGG
jgi:site-specific recombinase XerD